MPNRKWVVIPILFLVMLMCVTLKWGVADFNARTTENELAHWEKVNFVLERSLWKEAMRRADFSQNLDPGNPKNYEERARLYLLKPASLKLSNDEKQAAFQHALSEFRHASMLRPSSAYDWTMLMAIKSDLKEFDQEYLHAFETAVFLGPWEQATELVVADSGQKAWNRLSEQQKSQVLLYISRRQDNKTTP